MGQGDSARDFGTSESTKNAGILDVFPIFRTARLGQKIRRSPQLPPKRCCLRIIEDDALIRAELRTLLQANGCAAVEEGPCDLVLMDVNLPGDSGFTLWTLMIGTLYVSTVFVCMALAILAVKTL